MKREARYNKGDKIGGRYLVHQALLGGMGEVYLCLDLEEMQPLALKTFQQRYLTEGQGLRRAFAQEVTTWVALEKHPNVVQCYWMQTFDNQPFMALEWIAGEEGKGTDLRSWLRRGPLDLKLALEVAIDICHGLIHAQAKQPGLVHRDLKPENILMAQGGLAKITDFGLAQVVQAAGLEVAQEGAADSRQSLVGGKGIAGTPAYMAPEQWRGEALDERTDIYAIGCILHELLTGELPFTVDFTPTTPQQWQRWLQAMQVTHERTTYLKQPDAYAPALQDLLAACLAKTPSERPARLADLVACLAELYQTLFAHPPPDRPAAGIFTGIDYNNRGATYEALQQYKRARADFDHALELKPNFTIAFYNRGVTCHALQQYEQALADYGQALAIDPNFAQAHNNRGNTYQAMKQYERALADFDRALELDPSYPIAYCNRGLTYATLQQYKQALTDFDRALALDSNAASAYANRGNIHHALQQYKQALADYDKAIELDPSYIQAHNNRGLTLHALQQYERALADYNKALQLDPNFAITYYNCGLTYEALQQYERAVTNYDRALTLDSSNAQAHNNRGNSYYAMEQYQRALADFDQALTLDPNNAQAYNNRGNTFRAMQQYERALADFDQALRFDPNNAGSTGTEGGSG